MNDKILIVDDEKNILDAFQRQLRSQFIIETALGPEEGLNLVKNKGPYSVVISDLRMPVMDGIEFLSEVKKISSDTVQMILTGNADLESSIKAVNEGSIFRFLTKPCPPDTLSKAIEIGIEQYRLVIAEKELLQKTLKGSINILTEVLSLVNPEAFGRSSRIKRYVKLVAANLEIPNLWQLELAAMLSQIGCVILPEGALNKLYKGKSLSAEENQLFDMHPMIASDLISKIPRMQNVSEIIRYQEKNFDGSGNPKDSRKGEAIPLGSRILKAALDFDLLETKGMQKGRALMTLKKRSGYYDPSILAALESAIGDMAKYEIKNVTFKELKPNMILNDGIRTKDGRLLIARGQNITAILLKRLDNFVKTTGIEEPISVLISLL
jgi:response regulator RpfG family c-di-GMP phosphodiesterase